MLYFRVAEHIFGIDTTRDILACCPNYAPFTIDPYGASRSEELAISNDQLPLFTLRLDEGELPIAEGWENMYTDRSDDDMPRIEMYRREEEWMFCVSVYRDAPIDCAMQTPGLPAALA